MAGNSFFKPFEWPSELKIVRKVAADKIYTDEERDANDNRPLRFLGNCNYTQDFKEILFQTDLPVPVAF